jgi:hypothetical protein
VKVKKDGDKVRMTAANFDSDAPDQSSNAMGTATEWTEISVEFTTGSKGTSAKLYFWKDAGLGEDGAYGDKFELVEVK